MVKRLGCAIMLAVTTWAASVSHAEASCAGSSINVAALPTLISEAIFAAWHIEPACDVIESGLMLGREPTALAPVGQPIYGYRTAYQQAIPVSESGRYWIAAYAMDEAGGFIQSPPRLVPILVPPSLLAVPHGSHGAPSFYTGTDADFLQPAGNPHFASLKAGISTGVFHQPDSA